MLTTAMLIRLNHANLERGSERISGTIKGNIYTYIYNTYLYGIWGPTQIKTMHQCGFSCGSWLRNTTDSHQEFDWQ
jgi:hypothetical protein